MMYDSDMDPFYAGLVMPGNFERWARAVAQEEPAPITVVEIDIPSSGPDTERQQIAPTLVTPYSREAA